MHSNDRLATVFPFEEGLKIVEVSNIIHVARRRL
jgi:hypothetical protein